MRTARSAIHDVTLDTTAYGVLCQFLPDVLSPVFQLALEALDQLGRRAARDGDRVATTVAGTTGTDRASAARITAVELPW